MIPPKTNLQLLRDSCSKFESEKESDWDRSASIFLHARNCIDELKAIGKYPVLHFYCNLANHRVLDRKINLEPLRRASHVLTQSQTAGNFVGLSDAMYEQAMNPFRLWEELQGLLKHGGNAEHVLPDIQKSRFLLQTFQGLNGARLRLPNYHGQKIEREEAKKFLGITSNILVVQIEFGQASDRTIFVKFDALLSKGAIFRGPEGGVTFRGGNIIDFYLPISF